jgi:hypothetical protein
MTDESISRALKDKFGSESDRVSRRRAELEVVDNDAPVFGLALSGGGIRSATFALGALQGLANAAAPDTGAATPEDLRKQPQKSLLGRFDYLSTVSGGGYIGAFLCSLFVPARLWKDSTRRTAAEDAYRVLQQDPPGRIRTPEAPSRAHALQSALAWLRENGRYLTPVSAGDMNYAMALAIRNWFSVQYVLGTFIAAAFALVLSSRFALAAAWPTYASFEQDLLSRATEAPPVPAECAADPCAAAAVGVWWSPIFAAPLLVLVLWLAPLSIAFWLTHPARGHDASSPPRVFSSAAVAAIVLAFLSIGLGIAVAGGTREAPLPHVLIPFASGALVVLGLVWHVITQVSVRTITFHRVVMTRRLATGLQLFLALLVLALVDTSSQTLYLVWSHAQDFGTIASPAAAAAGGVWLFRALARLADRDGVPGVFSKLPIGLIAGIAGFALFWLIATLWGLGFHALISVGGTPEPALFEATAALDQAALLGVCLVAALALAIMSGRFSGFLNLSSLQSLYGARLTRAYLGGTNGERFKPIETERDRRRLSAAEPVSGDQLTRDKYYDTLAPLHVINVTMNQTIDPAEQLVQRDRKGRPLAILPTGFSIDRWHYDFRDHVDKGIGRGLGSQKLAIGQWIGTSGAAFTTGLGRSTSLGVSIALGLANMRLGMWWSSGYGHDRSGLFERAFKWLFKTQVFLFYELMAKFHGLHREWQYLSDGGHFENTGLYELLRPGRKVRLIVVCDDGCDPEYKFEDLANLVRLARIDHEVEVEVDDDIVKDAELGKVFATPKQFADLAAGKETPDGDDKCAVLLNVFAAGDVERTTRLCRIVVLKPRVIGAAPADVQEYAATHPAFPQEPTTDQFFDQSQWESYRSLGLAIARRVFGASTAVHRGAGPALWQYLQHT